MNFKRHFRSFRFRFVIFLATTTLMATGVLASEIVIKLGHVTSTVEPIHQSFEYYAEQVNKKTNGRVSIEIYPSASLGTNKEVYEQARLGANVIANVDAGYLSDYYPDIGVMNGPYLVVEPGEFNKIVESDWYRNVVNKVYEKGFQILALNGFFGPRHIISDKPIRNLADIKGLQIRNPPNVMWVETFKALGASPVTLAWSEVYSGLAQGVVDAAEAPLGSLWGAKLFEHKKVISTTGHFKAFVGIAMGRAYWETLPADVQAVLLAEGKQWGNKLTELTLASQESFKDRFRAEGVTFVEDIDYAAFQSATESVYSAFPDWTPGLHGQIKKILSQ